MVIVNRHRQTGLVVKQGRSYISCVLMDAAGITITKLTEDVFAADWSELTGSPNYNPKRMAASLLNAGVNFGITENAKAALNEVLVS